ncbi:DUF397 domain-containing protein [Streptomyces sp. NPDC017979]|uniref:DUF397 domain-containing protein n=1 Tax=Streptomyces sp. NPDC017979 TaxID=3365024 RepID=UPI0037A10A4C
MSLELSTAQWTKSSYSNNGGDCLEWAPAHAATHGTVPVRDSKRPEGPALLVSAGAFAGLVALARGAEL